MIQDMFGKEISAGQTVVYPTRPGGKGPLQLGFGKVQLVHDFGEIDVETESGVGSNTKVVAIKRTDRVVIVQH